MSLNVDVAVVRALVVAPADVDAHLLRVDVAGRVVERVDVQLRLLTELLERLVRELDVAPHAEVRAVDLQLQPGAR